MDRRESCQQSLFQMPDWQLEAILEKELGKEVFDEDLIRWTLRELERREQPDSARLPEELKQKPRQLFKEESKRKKRPTALLSVAAVAAVLCLVIFAVPPALGYDDIVQYVARWDDDFLTFEKEYAPEEPEYGTDNPGLQEIYDISVEYRTGRNVIPSWLPEGYELVELVNEPCHEGQILRAYFTKGNEGRIAIQVDFFDAPQGAIYFKNPGDVVQYEYNSVVHYIYTNSTYWHAVWRVDGMVCFLSACNEEDLYNMIWSVYCMED